MDLMHDDAEYAGVVEMLQQLHAVTTFHFEPTTEISHQRHEPVLYIVRHQRYCQAITVN